MSIEARCKHWLRGNEEKAAVAVLVIHKGKVVHRQAYGVADPEAELTPDTETIFDLASLSKHFTATAIMMLVERGLLSYEDPLTRFFPFPGYAEKITVRHLLNHTGGLKDYFELYEADGDDTSRWGEEECPTSADVVNALAQEPRPAFHAGKKFEYSNSGYVVLAEIVSQVSGKPFPQFMHEEVFAPLGMHRSYIFDGSQEPDENEAVGYEEGEPFETTTLDNVYGDGAVHTTLNDLARWTAALDGRKLVSEETQQEAWTSGTTNDGEETGYGFGWFVSTEDDEGTWCNHEGSYGGFETYCIKDLDEESTVFVLSNFAEAEPDKLGDAISEELAE